MYFTTWRRIKNFILSPYCYTYNILYNLQSVEYLQFSIQIQMVFQPRLLWGWRLKHRLYTQVESQCTKSINLSIAQLRFSNYFCNKYICYSYYNGNVRYDSGFIIYVIAHKKHSCLIFSKFFKDSNKSSPPGFHLLF